MRLHLGMLTFEKNKNHKNFLENFDLRQSLNSICFNLALSELAFIMLAPGDLDKIHIF